MAYCDLESAMRQLDLDGNNPDDADDITFLAGIDEEISRTFELKTGRKWGGTSTPTTRTVNHVQTAPSDLLLLHAPVRSVTSVVIIGNSPETLPATDYMPWMVTGAGDAFALRRIANGYWPIQNGVDQVTVTGVWSDEASGEPAPGEIIDAVTFVVVETFRQRKSSPTGEIGPDGLTLRPRNPWVFITVMEAIKMYAVAKPIASF